MTAEPIIVCGAEARDGTKMACKHKLELTWIGKENPPWMGSYGGKPAAG